MSKYEEPNIKNDLVPINVVERIIKSPRTKEQMLLVLNSLSPEEPTTQERQAESDKFDAAFQDGYNNGYAQARFDYEQEPILDKIRVEIETKYGQCDICEYFEDYDYEENDISEYRPIGNVADILQIIDKYKVEVDPQESED